MGILYLEEAIITILTEEPEGLNPIQISKALGIPAYIISPTDEVMASAIVHGVNIHYSLCPTPHADSSGPPGILYD